MVASLKSKAKQSFIYFSFILKLLKRRQVLYVRLKYKYLLLFYRGASCNCLFRSNKRYGNACYFFTTSNMSRYVNCKTTTSGKQNRRGIFFSGLFQFLFFTSFSIQFRHSNRGSQDPKTNSETPSSSFHEFCPFFFFKSYFIGQESYEYVGLVVL